MKRTARNRRLLLVFSACIIIGLVAATLLAPAIGRSLIPKVLVNGKVLTNPGTVPTRLVFSNSRDNYTAVVGDISASCACGGYYYQVTLPNQRDYAVDVYFGNSTGTYLCKTVLHLSSDSSILTHLVRCP